jgi:hypothetical protein
VNNIIAAPNVRISLNEKANSECIPISIFFKPLIQRHQPDGTFCILPFERLCPVYTAIQQQQLISAQFLRRLDQRPDLSPKAPAPASESLGWKYPNRPESTA